MPPPVPNSKSRRTTLSRRRLIGSTLGLILVAGVVLLWWSGPPEEDGFSSVPQSAGVPTVSEGVPTSPPTDATLARIAGIRDDFVRNAALYRLAYGATTEQIEHWLEELTTLSPSPHRYDVARVLYIRYAVLDPEAAVDHALARQARPSWLEAIFETWAQSDQDAAVANASVLHPSARAAASRALLQPELPRAEAQSVAERLDESADHHGRYRDLKAQMGLAPPTPAIRRLAEIEARRLARRADESHADAWTRALAVDHDNVRHILAEQTALDWAAEDPRAALAALELMDADDLVATGDVENRNAGVSVGPLQTRVRRLIITGWAEDDPHASLGWIVQFDGRGREYYIQSPMIEMTRRDPEEAISRLAAIPEELRENAMGAVLRTLAYRDLDRALEMFAALDVDMKAKWWLHTISLRRQLVEQRSAEDALGWAMSIDHRIRQREVAMLIDDVHEVDRLEALRLLEGIEEPELRSAAASRVVPDEVRHEAQAALAWAGEFKPEAARSTLVVRVFHVWARNDAEAASRGLFEYRGGPIRDRAAATMIPDLLRRDVHLAELVFDLIEAPDHQAKAAEEMVAHFADIEPNRRKADSYRKFLQGR